MKKTGLTAEKRLFLLCAAGTVCLAAGMIFLPRHISRRLDLRKMNQVTAADRDSFSFLEAGSNEVKDANRIFRGLSYGISELTRVSSLGDGQKQNSQLAETVHAQAMMAAEWGVIPYINSAVAEMQMGIYLEPWDAGSLKQADYYSLITKSDSESHTKELLNFWYLSFSDDEHFEYNFIVNASSYQIYYAEIYNPFTNLLAEWYGWNEEDLYEEEIEENSYEGKQIAGAAQVLDDYGMEPMQYYWMIEMFSYGCMEYYGAYDVKWVSPQNLQEKLALISLQMGEETIYMEQLSLPENELGHNGISIGLQNLGPELQKLIKKDTERTENS